MGGQKRGALMATELWDRHGGPITYVDDDHASIYLWYRGHVLNCAVGHRRGQRIDIPRLDTVLRAV